MMLHLFLWGSLVFPASTLTVFKLRPTSTNISYLTLELDPSVELPLQFIICTSHEQTSMDDRTFYHIYGDDGSPWMTTFFLNGRLNSVELWGLFGLDWKYFGDIEKPKLYFWYHMCAFVDTTRGLISISINGQMMESHDAVRNLKENVPKTLSNKITLGNSKYFYNAVNLEEQFLGSVSNVNIFSARNLSIEELSANPCSQNGDILSWQNATWIQTGTGIKNKEEDPSEVCSNSGTYDIRLAIGMTQRQALDTCDKLGHGRMKVSSNQAELDEFVKWFEKRIPDKCTNFWTPYSDATEESVFISLEDGIKPTFLPWVPGQPNGVRKQNSVQIEISNINRTIGYSDWDDSFLVLYPCFACLLSSSFSLKLRGLCENTVLGEGSFEIL